MKKYILYTSDGYTQDLGLKEIENCQILGFSEGNNEIAAFNNFIQNNSYIKNYDYEKIFAIEITGKPVKI